MVRVGGIHLDGMLKSVTQVKPTQRSYITLEVFHLKKDSKMARDISILK